MIDVLNYKEEYLEAWKEIVDNQEFNYGWDEMYEHLIRII